MNKYINKLKINILLIRTLMDSWGRPSKDFQGSLFVQFTLLSCEHLDTWVLSLHNSESPSVLPHSISLGHDLETLSREWIRTLVGLASFVSHPSRINAFLADIQCLWKHLIHTFCLYFWLLQGGGSVLSLSVHLVQKRESTSV